MKIDRDWNATPLYFHSLYYETYTIGGCYHRLDGPARNLCSEQNKWQEWWYKGVYIPVNTQKEFESYIRLLAFILIE